MRSVSNFLSGVTTGLGKASRRARAARPTPPARPVRSAPRRVAGVNTEGGLARLLGHLCVLVLAAACGAAALMAATHGPRRWQQSETSSAFPATQAATPDDLHEVLACDPAAPPREWRYLVIHHSATPGGSAQSFDQNHRERGWRCLGYHFVIGNGNGQADGVIVAGPRWYSQEAGAHANSNEYNLHGIGVCLVGNMDELPPTPAQWAATRALVAQLRRTYGISSENVVGHNQIRGGGATACPGKLTALDELRELP